MFHVHGIQGRVFHGTLEELRQRQLVTGVARVRRLSPLGSGVELPLAPPSDQGAARKAALAYGATPHTRERRPVRCAADIMHSPAITVPASATALEAWRMLARHDIRQAPVVDGQGFLIGLIGRIELIPAALLESSGVLAERVRLMQPVTTVMWTPVPSTAPDTDLRRVAALLLDTGLPGVPVADEAGLVLGFISRTDLLRAMTTDPPVDLWA